MWYLSCWRAKFWDVRILSFFRRRSLVPHPSQLSSQAAPYKAAWHHFGSPPQGKKTLLLTCKCSRTGWDQHMSEWSTFSSINALIVMELNFKVSNGSKPWILMTQLKKNVFKIVVLNNKRWVHACLTRVKKWVLFTLCSFENLTTDVQTGLDTLSIFLSISWIYIYICIFYI